MFGLQNRVANIIGQKPIQTVILFGLLAAGARFVPSPWWDGDMLSIHPELPEPSGAFVRAPDKNQTVKKELAKVEFEAAEPSKPAGVASRQTKTAESADETDVAETTTEADEPEARHRFDFAVTPDENDLKLLAKIRELDDKLDDPAAPLHRPCLAYVPGYLTDSLRPVCRRRALDGFFAQLRNVALKIAERPARISQFGDSLIAGDAFTGELRRLMHEQFGDGGYGFIHTGKASPHIGTRHLTTDTSSGWKVHDVIYEPHSDAKFGLAGVAFEATGYPTLGIYPHDEGHGRTFDRVGILYYRRNQSVDLQMTVDDSDGRRLDLSGPAGTNALRWLQVDRGVHKLRFRGFDRSAYYYGVILENSGPGVVVDNLGLSNGRAPRLDYAGEKQWQGQLRKRGSDLLSFAYGVNSAGKHKAADHWLSDYAGQYASVLKAARTSSDRAGCLVISLLTRAGREEGDIEIYDSVEPLVRYQRKAARRADCAFWNAYEAMGGPEGAENWYNNRPRLLCSDLAHPTGIGYKKLANMFYASLIHQFRRYLDERIRRTTIPELREDDVSEESILSLRATDGASRHLH